MKAHTFLAIALLALTSPTIFAAGEREGQPFHRAVSEDSSEARMHVEQMETHMKEMRKEMAEIYQIKDSDERKTRLREHLADMAKMMQEMRKMRPHMSPPETAAHLQMVDNRLDLLQDLVDQMLKSQMMSDEDTFDALREHFEFRDVNVFFTTGRDDVHLRNRRPTLRC